MKTATALTKVDDTINDGCWCENLPEYKAMERLIELFERLEALLISDKHDKMRMAKAAEERRKAAAVGMADAQRAIEESMLQIDAEPLERDAEHKLKHR